VDAEVPADQAAPGASRKSASEPEPIPAIDFMTFVISLASNALLQMGATGESHPEIPVNLPMARQTIDILAMLQQKTKGNLTGEEERLIDHVLYDLRMQFVAATRKE
jgi:hypothetical protein